MEARYGQGMNSGYFFNAELSTVAYKLSQLKPKDFMGKT